MQDDFPPVPSNATGPPPPEYGAVGEHKNDRDPPGGYLGKKKGHKGHHGHHGGGGNDIDGPGPVVIGPVEPDPSEPDYSVSLSLYSNHSRIYEKLSSDD